MRRPSSPQALLLLAALTLPLAGCDSNGASQTPGGGVTPPSTGPAFTSPPTLGANPNPAVALAGRLSFSTDVPTTAVVNLVEGARSWSLASPAGLSTDHVVDILGVRPDRTHTLTAVVTTVDGESTVAEDVLWTTPSLPNPAPPASVTVPAAAGVQPGVTLMSLRWTPTLADQDFANYLVMYDAEGEVVWLYGAPDRVSDARRLRNGNILFLMGRNGGVEIDMFGETVQWWWGDNVTAPPSYATDLGWPEPTLLSLDTMHHEMFELPQGGDADFLVLSTELRELADYPIDEVDPTQTEPLGRVVGDVVAEITRDGQVVRQWSLFDYLDPYRLSYDSLGGFWNPVYGGTTHDWTHANAVVPDLANDGHIVSLRHQDAVIHLSRQGKLNWILGSHDRWVAPYDFWLLDPLPNPDFQAPDLGVPFGTPASQFEWNFHQHAPMLTQAGDLLMFDNGNGRTVPPTPALPNDQRYSRAVRFSVDAGAKTVAGVWEYGSQQDPWYSLFISDADELENGNVLICSGGEASDGPSGQLGSSRLVEVSSASPAEVLWELTIKDDAPVDPLTWNAYRAERLSGVYPQK